MTQSWVRRPRSGCRNLVRVGGRAAATGLGFELHYRAQEVASRVSAELSHSLKIPDGRRNRLESAQNRSESLCAGLWVPYRVFGAWFGPALDPNQFRNRRLPAGSLQVFGALLAQPIRFELQFWAQKLASRVGLNLLGT